MGGLQIFHHEITAYPMAYFFVFDDVYGKVGLVPSTNQRPTKILIVVFAVVILCPQGLGIIYP